MNLKNISKPTKQSISFYLIAFFIPIIFFSLIMLCYHIGIGKIYPNTFSFVRFPIVGIASFSLAFYLRTTQAFKIKSSIMQLSFAYTYGLSSFVLTQEKDIFLLLLFALFPFLFLTFEWMTLQKKYIPFSLCSAIMLFASPSAGIPILILLFFLCILETASEKRLQLGNFLHILFCFLFSAIMAGFSIFFYLTTYIIDYDTYKYTGFNWIYSPALFLAKLLPGSIASSQFFFTHNKMDLSFGLFFLLLSILFFMQKDIFARRRIYYGIYTILLIFVLELTPFQFVFNLFIQTNKYTTPYSFFFVFWGLRLAAESWSHMKQTTMKKLLASTIIITLIIGVAWCFYSHNFLPWLLPVHILLLVLYVGSIFILRFKKHRKSCFYILAILILIEVGMNTVIVTNVNLKPENPNVTAQFFYQKVTNTVDTEDKSQTDTNEKTDDQENDDSATDIAISYQNFIENHLDEETTSVLNNLLNILSEEDIAEYNETLLPDIFELCNIAVHKLGFEDEFCTEFPIDIQFEANDSYEVTSYGNNIFHFTSPDSKRIASGYLTYTIKPVTTLPKQPVYLYENSDSNIFLADEDMLSNRSKGYFKINSESYYSVNCQILSYTINTSILTKLSEAIEKYQTNPDEKASVPLKYDIIGMIISYIGFMILVFLLGYNRKEKIYVKLYDIRNKISNSHFAQSSSSFFKRNRVYLLSFLLPFLFIIAILLIHDCAPFGENTIFDEDGIALTLPSYMDTYYNLKNGNTYLSMNAGYAMNTYLCNPIAFLSYYFRFLSSTQLPAVLSLQFALWIGLSGLFMTIYMTHRHTRPVNSTDIRLLLPAIIYALNAYMLRMHGFTSWYLCLMLFPLLLLAMEHLVYRRKCILYIILLTLCICTNLQLAMYMCIFLIIAFFTCHFNSVKDFFMKGIRFGFSSILAAGNSFFIIYNTLSASKNLLYQYDDSVFPTLGLHGNFLTEWKNYMICSPSMAVSTNDGDLYAYCSILALVLTLVYFCSRQITLSEKIRKIVPIIFLCISFNGQVLSYLWNGMHYQSKVPNRYTFLLLFIVAEIALDGLLLLQNISRHKFTLIISGMIIFFLCCQSYEKGNTKSAFILTLLLCFLYLLLHLYYYKRNKLPVYHRILLSMVIIELAINTLFSANSWNVNGIRHYGSSYEQTTEFIQNKIKTNADFLRCCFTYEIGFNHGQMFNVSTNNSFNSLITKYQTQLNSSYGFLSGSNCTGSNYISTPMGLALSSTKYLFIPLYNTAPFKDIEQYKYIGTTDIFYVFENPNVLSLGIYVPENALTYNEKMENVPYYFTPYYYNLLSEEYITSTNTEMFTPQQIIYSDDTNADNSFYFTDQNGKQLTYEAAKNLYLSIEDSDSQKLQMHINITANKAGDLYFYPNELVSLGKVAANEHYQISIEFPNELATISTSYYTAIFDKNVFEEFYDKASQNQLENITISNDTITGTTNYEEDGYTMLSIPYDKSWSAYIDGEEVEIENPYDTGLYVKTPAGKHTLELKFIPYGMKTSKRITYGFWIFTVLLGIGCKFRKRHKNSVPV